MYKLGTFGNILYIRLIYRLDMLLHLKVGFRQVEIPSWSEMQWIKAYMEFRVAWRSW